MQLDFHYYATYCAACLAGYPHEECLKIAFSAQFVDCCSRTMLEKLRGPLAAATTQLQLELMNANTDPIGLQDITRIWSSFHFLPGDLHAEPQNKNRLYRSKYRLICNPNGSLLKDTVELARGKGPEAAGLAMHVLADTWAHRYFAGTPSLVINNTNYYFYEILGEGRNRTEKPILFNRNPNTPDDPDRSYYTNSLYQGSETSVMNLGHGRAGHLPDYSYARYRYMPAWGGYREIIKDNPSDYMHAFRQMVYALRCLREGDPFETDRYAEEEVFPWEEPINDILKVRRTNAEEDWKDLGGLMSGCSIPDFDTESSAEEYRNADEAHRDGTVLGRFILAALSQKSMVTNKIFTSGNMLAGFSVDFKEKGFKGIRDFRRLAEQARRQAQ